MEQSTTIAVGRGRLSTQLKFEPDRILSFGVFIHIWVMRESKEGREEEEKEEKGAEEENEQEGRIFLFDPFRLLLVTQNNKSTE